MERQPKYKVTAKEPGKEMPHTVLYAYDVPHKRMLARQLHHENPGHKIEARLIRNFEHGKACRWLYDPTTQNFHGTVLYDQSASGTTNP